MSFIQRIKVTVTTNGSGAATEYTPNVSGRICQIHYVKTDFSDGVDFTITAEATGETIWTQENVNASAIVSPRRPTHDTAGVASVYAAGGEPVEDKITLGNDRIKIVIAAGGASKVGTFHFLIE